MLTFAYYLLKVLICSGILYGYYLLALRNKRFHQYNRWYLLSAVALSFLIPIVRIEFWKETVQPSAVMKVITIVYNADVYVAQNTPTIWSWDNIMLTVFGCISFIFLLSIIVSLVKIFILIKQYPKKLLEKICFVVSNTPGTPFSFFNYIFWNKEIDIESETGTYILKHELAHVHEKHSSDKLFLNFVLVIGWCNPFFWLIRKELNLIHEFIADQKAVSDGDAHALAMMLLKTSHPSQSFMFVNSFFYSPIKRRLLMLTKLNPRYSYVRRIMVLPLLTAVVLFFAFKHKEKKQQQHAYKSASSTDTLVPPKFPGGTPAWNRYLQRNIQWTTLEKSGAPKGSYKVAVKFNVDRTGRISNVNALTKNGYGFEDQAIRVVKKGPNWEPAHRGGKNVDAVTQRDFYFTIPISKVGISQLEDRNVGELPGYDKTFSKVEQPPSYSKGDVAFMRYVQSNLRYPAEARQKKIEGRVVINFIVNRDGNLTNFEPLTSLGSGLEDEAIRLLKNSSPWKPAMQSGKKVIFQVKQSIDFVLGSQVATSGNEEPAKFPGGADAWRKFLAKNLNASVATNNKAPMGNYTVKVVFDVSKDGGISNIIAETNPGYGTGEEAVKVIAKGPNWEPAKRDDLPINSRVTQWLTFMVADDSQDDDAIAQFPGGLEEWRRYIFRNTDFKALNQHVAPNGKYTVGVSFTIGKDGSISNVIAETNGVYGAEEEAVRIIKKSRKWQPSKKFGNPIDTQVKQTITYTVVENQWGIVEVNSITVGEVQTNFTNQAL